MFGTLMADGIAYNYMQPSSTAVAKLVLIDRKRKPSRKFEKMSEAYDKMKA